MSFSPSLPSPTGPSPSDILFLILSGALTLLTAFTLGGLAALLLAG